MAIIMERDRSEVKMAKPKKEFSISLSNTSLRKQLEHELRNAIVQARFKPGEHLSDRVLCEMFGVSRTLVREAVRQLEAEGLIQIIPHRGTFVNMLSVEMAVQIYEVRAALEGLVASGFVKSCSDEQIDELEDIVKQIASKKSPPVDSSLLELKQRFYSVLMEGSGNDFAREMLRQIYNRIAQLRATTLSAPNRLGSSIRELKKLVAAIRRRDAEGASAAAVEHVVNASRVAIRILEKGGSRKLSGSGDTEDAKKCHRMHYKYEY